MAMVPWARTAAAVAGLVLVSTRAFGKDAATIDLPKLIECRADMDDYMGLATKIGPGSQPPAGWTKIEQSNPFIAEYELAKPITVFGGYKTRRVALAGSGVLAIIDEKAATPKALAAKLQLAAVSVGSDRVIFARVVKSTNDNFASVVIRLNASTISSHPGKTFAGCEYQLNVK